jgi:DMSO/TMAO reductase YedYZ molybdopterin-dependent catalytic subunit
VVEGASGDRPAGASTRTRAELSAGQARLAGVLAALVALAVGELLSGLAGSDQSLIGSVGTSFIDRFAASLKDIAVQAFGTSDKAALLIGIVLTSVVLGAVVGSIARTRPQVGTLAFAGFGLVGLLCGWADPQTNKLMVSVAAVGATAAGILTLRLLFRVARGRRVMPPGPEMAGLDPTLDAAGARRAFLQWSGGAAAFALVTTLMGRTFAGRSKAEVARESRQLPSVARNLPNAGTVPDIDTGIAVEGISPYYVSNASFYRIDTALVVPQVDPENWRLQITGMVDRPYSLTFDELLALPQVEQAVTLQCVSNDVGGDLVGNARWQGVPLKAILDKAGVQAGATQIVGKSVDGWTAGFPTDVALDGRTALVAVGMNRELLPITHGFPARLVVAGLYGYVSATKWLSEIRLTTWEDFDGYWVPRGWSKKGPIKTQSRIDVPRLGASLQAGPQKIAGIALAPSRGIAKVEVQIDDGPWREARLGRTVSKDTWVQWVLDWDATPGEHLLRVRATDGTGETQTEDIAAPAPDGASGWHRNQVTVS